MHSYYNPNGYEDAPSTELLATHCIMCGNELTDARSIERGVGPICAEKYGVSAPSRPADEALFQERMEKAPQPIRDAVLRQGAADDPRSIVNRLVHAAGHAWKNELPDWRLIVLSAAELAQALGFEAVHEKLVARYVVGEPGGPRVNGLQVVDAGGGKWMFKLPYISNKGAWRDIANALRRVGAGGDRNRGWRHVFDPSDWLKVLNVLTTRFAGEPGVLPTGEVFVIPNEPLPIPGEGQATEADPVPGAPPEDPEWGVDPNELSKGMRVTMRDGREMEVKWIGERDGEWRVGLADPNVRGRGGLIFCGVRDVKTTPPTKSDKELVREDLSDSNEPTTDRPVSKRELPEGMFEHQREGALWLDSQGSGILTFEPGLGKTLTALAVIDPPVVIVSPNNVKFEWQRETLRWRPDLTVAVIGSLNVTRGEKLEGESDAAYARRLQQEAKLLGKRELEAKGYPAKTAKEKREANITEQMKADVVIINYELMQKKPIVQQLIERNNRTIVIDESHRLKGLRIGAKKVRGEWVSSPWKSSPVTTVGIWEVAQPTKKRILLTGTPAPNGRNSELFSQLHLVAPNTNPFRTFKQFCDRYCPPEEKYVGGGRTIKDYNTSVDSQGLHQLISGKLWLRKKKEECLDLPEKTRITKYVTLDAESVKQYEKASADFLKWLGNIAGNEARIRASRAEAITKMNALRRISGIGKVPAFVDGIMEHLRATGRPLVVMANHQEVAVQMKAMLDELGDDEDAGIGRPIASALYGWGISSTESQRIKDHFQDGLPMDAPPEERHYLDVIICSIMKSREGLNLTRASDTYFIERVWTPAYMVQAEDRIHRISQTRNCTITYFEGSGTIDGKIAQLLVEKMKTMAEVVDGHDVDEEGAVDMIYGELLDEVSGGGYASNPGADPYDLGWLSPGT